MLTDDALFIYRRIGDTYVRKTVCLNCTFTTVIENIYKGEDSAVLEFGNNNMKLDVTENCTCNEYEMTVAYNETTITINWEEDYI